MAVSKASLSRPLPKSRPLTISAEPGLRFMRLGRGGALEIASSPRVEILIDDVTAFLNELLRALASSVNGQTRLSIAATALHPATAAGHGDAGDTHLALELGPGRHLHIALPAGSAAPIEGRTARDDRHD
jgi:hypothetical protein